MRANRILIAMLLVWVTQVHALQPGQVAVVANARSEQSIALAKEYMQARGIPPANLLTAPTSTELTLSRQRFNEEIRDPLRRQLIQKNLQGKIHCLTLVWGMPVQIDGKPGESAGTSRSGTPAGSATSRPGRLPAQALRIGALPDRPASLVGVAWANASRTDRAIRSPHPLTADLSGIALTAAAPPGGVPPGAPTVPHLHPMAAGDEATDATVDSELALLWFADHELARFVPNPLHWSRPGRGQGRRVLLTARLDGPTTADAERLFRGALRAEKQGLTGAMYIDAGGPHRRYDAYLTDLAEQLKRRDALPVVLDTRAEVFPRGSCPNAALYVGWHAPGKYVPAFTWRAGAVGWHIGSAEAAGLRDPASRDWCTQMILNGCGGTIGALRDPYLGAFPRPDEFFPLLLTGKVTLAECYWRTVPSASWRLVLLGDPLYNPYAADPKLSPDDLPKGLAP